MSKIKKCRTHTAEFKAKVELEAIRSVKTINQIAQEHNQPRLMFSNSAWRLMLNE